MPLSGLPAFKQLFVKRLSMTNKHFGSSRYRFRHGRISAVRFRA
jgi:hypothetical protein